MTLGLLLGAFLPSISVTQPGAMTQVVLAVVAIALVAVTFALTGAATTTVTHAARVGGPAAETHNAARQCNPDAAGHVRSRAPGRRRPVCC